MKTEIKHTYSFKCSPEEVWEYLTKAELLEKWLMQNNFELNVGAHFQFYLKPVPEINFDGNIYCTVLEIIPLKKLSYSWKNGSNTGGISLDSTIEWTLHQNGKITELHLLHSGFDNLEHAKLYAAMHQGWVKNMGEIAKQINALKDGTT